MKLNEYGQPVGDALPDWQPAEPPEALRIDGKFCCLERLDAQRHAESLYHAFQQNEDGRSWTYLPYGPFESLQEYRDFLLGIEAKKDPYQFAIIDNVSARAVGTVSLMRIDVTNGVIETGHLVYSPLMQRTAISTEVMSLLLEYVFITLGYRRLEWKCDALNAPSRAAAERFGFTFEGIFRQMLVTQGRNRDTAWYAILDHEYAKMRAGYAAWLASDNFDAAGRQKQKLAEFLQY